VLGETVAVRCRHGTSIERDGRTYLITCHPSAAARFPAIRRAVWHDLSMLKTLVDGSSARGSASPLRPKRTRRRVHQPR
jgi:hypothetical protein